MPRTRPHKRVAVMQPYFFPYAGYFRLFSQVDEFVVLDCVQFPASGRVHRTEVPGPGSASEWLTLPLARRRHGTPIRELAFAADARTEFDRRLARLPWVRSARGPAAERLRAYLHAPLGEFVDYVEAGLRLVNGLLDIATPITRSSALALDASLRGQERILAIVQARGGTHYVNAPGGRHLYDAAAFERLDIGLEFLPPYAGRYFQLLPALMHEAPAAIRADLESVSPSSPPACG